MGSPQKPIDVEMGEVDSVMKSNGEKVEEDHPIVDEAAPLKPEVKVLIPEFEKSDDSNDRFTGLKKEELMRIANQPQWKRARWVLFVLFWILWVGMLVAAILIVVNAPKCKPIPELEWYKDTVLYKAEPKEFADNYKGVIDRMKYIKDLKATLLLSKSATPDFNKPSNDEVVFKEMIKQAAENEVKVIVELEVGTVSTTSDAFLNSQKKDCNEYCNFFTWKDAPEAGYFQANSSDRSDNWYKGTEFVAAVNYDSPKAVKYLKDAADSWYKQDVDGIYVDGIPTSYAKSVTDALWSTNTASNDEKKRALFVKPATNKEAFDLTKSYSAPMNNSIGGHSPVFALTSWAEDYTAKKLADVKLAREERVTLLYVNEADTTNSTSNLSLALTLSNLMLPGVSVINSGEEYGEVANTKFIWDEASNKPDLAATHEGKLSLSMVQSAIKKKTADTLSKPSLRYDTRDEDTVFEFVDQGDQNVVGFWRKYHTKSGVYVVTNLSDKMIPIQLKAIQQHEEKLELLKVLITSRDLPTNQVGKTLEVKKDFDLPAYATLVLIAA